MKEYVSFIDFTNMNDEEKYKLLNSKDYEIEKLNNIINELEKFLIQLNTEIKEITNVPFDVKEIMEQLDKLQELKGVDKE